MAKLLNIPRPYLVPMILLFSITGVYLVSFNSMDILIMVAVCVAALGLRLLNFPMAPMLLGFILGGMHEDNLRRGLLIGDGELSFLWERPLTLSFISIAALVLFSPLLRPLWERSKAGLDYQAAKRKAAVKS
ncbi:tripartite tricarboxylate transporter permease [Agarivorans sp. QJM3NY_25]|uniref:tripartite tricarboxylate transporter permease n=1 Tax=Agarivorans sp. QJM3NY_25 TaxID=3421430 RepID=UPI003F6D499D